MRRVETFGGPGGARYTDTDVETNAPRELDDHHVLAYTRAPAEAVLVVKHITRNITSASRCLGS